MKYFNIFGNLCSILGFVAAISIIQYEPKIPIPTRWLIFALIALTVIFWLIFYFAPQNPISRFIDSRTDFTGKYSDSQAQVLDIIEGEFEVNTSNWGATVMLPPFEIPPKIKILFCFDCDNANAPQLIEVTEDNFKVKINSSSQTGKWRWRARGKLLKQFNMKNQ